jgi:probable F420-dependent oxidoreductase
MSPGAHAMHMKPKPFRFGTHVRSVPGDDWVATVREIEALGYSSIAWPDHFHSQWDPIAAPAAAAAVTSRLKVATMVFDVDYRHPVVHAKSAATLALLSKGRFECGIGAGWSREDYTQAGIDFASHATRIERLEEALQIMKAMWTQPRTSFEGKHYQIRDIAQAVELPAGLRPPILVGGGRPKILGVAGRHADIIGINVAMAEGHVTPQTAQDMAPEQVQRKLEWIEAGLQSAGRSFDDVELHTIAFVTAFVDDAAGVRKVISNNTGMTPQQIAECPTFLIGSPAEIRDRLERQREQTGISYVTVKTEDMALLRSFAEHVIEPLRGK